MRGEEVCQEFSALINQQEFDIPRFIRQFNKENPYIQQIMFNIAVEIIRNCARDDFVWDERNEWAHTFGKELWERYTRDESN